MALICWLFFLSMPGFAADRPNVIVVLADDIGVGDISHLRRLHSGTIKLETPHLDALAQSGMIFTQAHSPAALCAPSRYAVMTGNSCYRSRAQWGVWGAYEESPVKETDLTLGRLMKRAGYQTAFFGKWNLGGDYSRKSAPGTIYRAPRVAPELDVDISRMLDGPEQKGFDYSLTFPVGIQDVPYAVFENMLWMPLEEDSEIGHITQAKMDSIGVTLDKEEGLGDTNWDPHEMGPLLVNKAVTYISTHSNQEDPFFIYYCSQAVHLPHTPPDSLNGIPIAGTTPTKHMDMIKELDVQMGMIIDALKAQGVYDNTLIIFTSDNGGLTIQSTMNTGHRPSSIYRGGKNSRFEGGHRVPFMVSWPDSIDPGQSSNEPVLGLDVMATLASITGTEIGSSEALDSYDLFPILQNRTDARSHAFLMLQGGTGSEVILIEEGWKLIIQQDKSGMIREPIALYDLNTNPSELESQNYINHSAHKSRVNAMLAKYNEVRNSKIPTKNYKAISVPYNHPHIYWEGRIRANPGLQASEIWWPGSSISLKFIGDSVSATLEDRSGTNYFNVVVDGEHSSVLHLEQGKKTYVLAANLEDGTHTVELHKRNDWSYGWTRFYGFNVRGSTIFPIAKKERLIEFYGNSITTGYGNEDYTGQDRPTGDVSNNYNAYGAMTARNLGAEYSCISHSGIGIMVSWHNMIMPEEYYRFDPFNGSSYWDFSSKPADVVVVNLFQNDSWIVKLPDNAQFKKRFGTTAPTRTQIVDAYVDFLRKIRSKYPDAEIICLLGNMDITKPGSPWPGYVTQAARIFNDRAHTLYIPYKNSPGHPKVAEQKKIADALTDLILRIDDVHTVTLNLSNSHTGMPVVNSSVIIGGDSIQSDHNGRATYHTGMGTYQVAITHERYADTSFTIIISKDAEVLIDLDQTYADVKFVVKMDQASLSDANIAIGGQSVLTSTIGMANIFNLKTDTAYVYRIESQAKLLAEDTLVLQSDTTLRLYYFSTVSTDQSQEERALIYPNPANTQFMVRGVDGPFEYEILDLNGKVLLSGIGDNGETIDVTELASGLYFLSFGQTQILKLSLE